MPSLNKNIFFTKYKNNLHIKNAEQVKIFFMLIAYDCKENIYIKKIIEQIQNYKSKHQTVSINILIVSTDKNNNKILSNEINKLSYENFFFFNEKVNNVFIIIKNYFDIIKKCDYICVIKLNNSMDINDLLYYSLINNDDHINTILSNFYENKKLGIISAPHHPNEIKNCLMDEKDAILINCITPLIDKKLRFKKDEWIDWTPFCSFWGRIDFLYSINQININNTYTDKICGMIFLYVAINQSFLWSRIDINHISFYKKHDLKSPTINTNKNKKRIFIVASYNKDNKILDSLTYLLSNIRNSAYKIIFVSDNDFSNDEIKKISKYIDHSICRPHGKYDFGSYSIGLNYALQNYNHEKIDEIILCNDSVFGPITPLEKIFESMESINCDFWGINHDVSYAYYIQTWFIVFKYQVFSSALFLRFMDNINVQPSQKKVILNYEITLTQFLLFNGYKASSFDEIFNPEDENLIFYPLTSIKNGVPYVKKKSINNFQRQSNESVIEVLYKIYSINQNLCKIICQENKIDNNIVLERRNVYFSIIIPTFNRKLLITKAIDSILEQDYKLFEIIIVDDCSTDGTVEYLKNKYNKYISTEKIRIIENEKRYGPSYSRNRALSIAKYKWIAYVDSDNSIRHNFLSVYYDAIVLNNDVMCFYSKALTSIKRRVIGEKFDYNKLKQYNYIDLGTFIHNIKLYNIYGGFDEQLPRLVDWDLILKYTKENECKFLDIILMDYDDSNRNDRITNNYNVLCLINYIKNKHIHKKGITSLILTYNHEQFISDAIESAIEQKCLYNHQILISDDNSEDKTMDIIEKYTKKYPNIVKNISNYKNKGISKNYLYSFLRADNEYVAILEGDDYWIDQYKNAEQLDSLQSNLRYCMAFSKVKMLKENGTMIDLDRHKNLNKDIKTVDFFNSKEFNILVTFSTCMFKKSLFCMLPHYLFESRLSELAIALYFLRFGDIRFIDKTQTLYWYHQNGVWSGMTKRNRLISSFITRIQCFNVVNNKDMFIKFKGNEIRFIFDSLKKEGINIKQYIKKYIKTDAEKFNKMLFS